MRNLPERSTRYGVEIKLPTVHRECDKLEEVLTLLEGQSGIVRVFDRFTRELVVDDTAHAARQSLNELRGRRPAMKLLVE
jgi:hypothetical protein